MANRDPQYLTKLSLQPEWSEEKAYFLLRKDVSVLFCEQTESKATGLCHKSVKTGEEPRYLTSEGCSS